MTELPVKHATTEDSIHREAMRAAAHGSAGGSSSSPSTSGAADSGAGAQSFEGWRGFATGGPLLLLRAEGALVAIAATILFRRLGGHWSLFAAAFLLPDLSMLGYLGGRRAGAIVYDAVHTYLAPGALVVAGTAFPEVLPLAATWFAHIGLDRMLQFGLKYSTAFGDTHLGRQRASEAAEVGRVRGARHRRGAFLRHSS
jgi:hypothetical protein